MGPSTQVSRHSLRADDTTLLSHSGLVFCTRQPISSFTHKSVIIGKSVTLTHYKIITN